MLWVMSLKYSFLNIQLWHHQTFHTLQVISQHINHDLYASIFNIYYFVEASLKSNWYIITILICSFFGLFQVLLYCSYWLISRPEIRHQANNKISSYTLFFTSCFADTSMDFISSHIQHFSFVASYIIWFILSSPRLFRLVYFLYWEL